MLPHTGALSACRRVAARKPLTTCTCVVFCFHVFQAEKVVVKTSSASVVQARIVYMTQPAEAKWVQIMLDIAVAANPPVADL